MSFLIKIFLIIIIILSNNLFARTRTEVIEEANAYKDYSWTVGPNNILDIRKRAVKNASGIYEILRPEEAGQDGIDDRMNIVDLDKDLILDDEDWAAMRANWPFKPEDEVTGEAYAYGYAHYAKPDMKPPDDVLKKWYANQTKSFEEYLAEGRIAGRKADDAYDTRGSKTFTGLDCSGFITRVWGSLDYHLSTELLGDKWGPCVEIDWNDLKPGDILLYKGEQSASGIGHVILFAGWHNEVTKDVAKIYHSAAKSLDTDIHMRRVIYEVVSKDKIK